MIYSIYNDGGGLRGAKFDPRQLRYDEYGLPILSEPKIESIADELLQTYCPLVLKEPRMTPVIEILDILKGRTGLSSALVDLGYKGTAKVIGRVSFTKKILYLDSSLTDKRRAAFRFTVAHEIGHWVLHRYNYENWKFDDEESNPTMLELEVRAPLHWRNMPRQRLERQAKLFAASLVTPRSTFVPATTGLRNRTINEEELVRELADVFKVSKECVRVRIDALGLFRKNFLNF